MTVSFQNGSFLNGTSSASSYTQSGGISVATLYNTDALDSKYEYTDTKESYEIAYSGRDAAIESYISNILSYLSSGQEDKALAAYNALLTEMGSQTRYAQLVGEDGDDTQLRAVARQLIEAELGTDLATYIEENSRDAAGVTAQKIRTWGNCDSTSQEDLLAEMCNLEVEGGNNLLLDAVSLVASPFVVLGNLIFNGNKKVN